MMGLLFHRFAGPVATAAATILALLLAVVLVQKAAETRRADRAEKRVVAVVKERDRALSDLGACRTNTATLETVIAAQNAAVDRLGKAGDRMARAAETAVRDARRAGEAHRDAAARTLAARPQSCDDLSGLIEGGAR